MTTEPEKTENSEKKKGFFARLFDKLDRKMKDEANKRPCCGGDNPGKSSCC